MKLLRYKTFEDVTDIADKCDLLMSLTAKREPEITNWSAFHAVASMYMRRFNENITLNEMADRFVELYKKKKDKFFFGIDKLKEYEAIPNKHLMGIAFQKGTDWVGIYDVDASQRFDGYASNTKKAGYYKGPDMDEACKIALGFY